MSLIFTFSIFLCSALILGLLAKRYQLSPIIGYMLAGTILGATDATALSSLQAWANQMLLIGAVLLLFLLGLNVRLEHVLQRAHLISKHAAAMFLLTSTCFALCSYFLLSQSLLISVLLACSLAMGSRLVVLHAAEQDSTQHSQNVLQQLLFNSLFGMLILALIPLCLTITRPEQSLAYLAILVAACCGLMLLAQFVVQPLAQWLHRHQSQELLWLLMVVTLMLSILLMQTFSLPLLLGAFLAGLVLARSQLTPLLAPLLHPLKSLILALFFISLTLLTPFDVLLQASGFIAMCTGGLLVIKWLIAYGIAYLQHKDWQQALMPAWLLCCGGELGLILINLTHLSLEFDPLFRQSLNMSIMLSMLISSLFLAKPWQYFSQKSREPLYSELLIIGFGRMGQLIGRVAHLHGQAFSAIDANIQDPALVKDYQATVFHADATLPQTLLDAGLMQTQLAVLCLDDGHDTLRVLHNIQALRPDLDVLVRVRNRQQQREVQALGYDTVWQEHYETSCSIAKHAMQQLGVLDQRLLHNFIQHDAHLMLEHPVELGHYDAAQLSHLAQLMAYDQQLKSEPTSASLHLEHGIIQTDEAK